MYAIKRILIVFTMLILFVGGLAGGMTLLSWEPVARPVTTFINIMPTTSLFLVFVIFVLIPILVFIGWIQESRKRGIIITETEDGKIFIRDVAIVKCIRNGLRKLPDVLSVQANIKNTSRGIVAKVRTQVKITAGVLPELNRQMREIVLDTLTRVLGISNIADVKIYIEDMKVSDEQVMPPPSEESPPEMSYDT